MGKAGSKFPWQGHHFYVACLRKPYPCQHVGKGGFQVSLAGPSLLWIMFEKVIAVPTLVGMRVPLCIGRAVTFSIILEFLIRVPIRWGAAGPRPGNSSSPSFPMYVFIQRWAMTQIWGFYLCRSCAFIAPILRQNQCGALQNLGCRTKDRKKAQHD